jgi:hypothetical protein
MKRYSVLIGFILFCMGCATFSVNYDFDPEADFARIKTYDWSPIPEKAKMDELALKHIKFDVNKQLQAKGLSMSPEKPDILIAVHGGKEKRVDVQEWGYQYGDYNYIHTGPFPGRFVPQPAPREYYEYRSGLDTYEYEVGTLVLDIVDANKKTLIWRGTATGVVDPDKPSEQINEIVSKMFDNFPPVKKK